MNIGLIIVAIIGGTAGVLSTIYLTVSFPAVILWKIYRKICHGTPLTD